MIDTTLDKQAVFVPGWAPTARRYSPAVKVPLGDGRALLFITGQIPKNAAGQPVGVEDLGAQARAVFANLAEVLAAAGGGLGDLVALTLYVTDMSRFAEVSAVRDALFPGFAPASSVVEVSALCRPEYQIEVSGTAVIPAG